MAEVQFTPEQIERATVGRFTKFTNYLRDQQASPVVLIAWGHVGPKRSVAEPILCIPEDLADSGSIDWFIEILEATLVVFENQRARMRTNIAIDPRSISLEGLIPGPDGMGQL